MVHRDLGRGWFLLAELGFPIVRIWKWFPVFSRIIPMLKKSPVDYNSAPSIPL